MAIIEVTLDEDEIIEACRYWAANRVLSVGEALSAEVAWMFAQSVAIDVIMGGCEFCTGADYYHEKSIRPYWADDYRKVGMVGDHIFYANDQ